MSLCWKLLVFFRVPWVPIVRSNDLKRVIRMRGFKVSLFHGDIASVILSLHKVQKHPFIIKAFHSQKKPVPRSLPSVKLLVRDIAKI